MQRVVTVSAAIENAVTGVAKVVSTRGRESEPFPRRPNRRSEYSFPTGGTVFFPRAFNGSKRAGNGY